MNIKAEIAEKAAKAIVEQLEYDLRGAWRAGYNYLHVYDKMGTTEWSVQGEQFTLAQYTFPSKSKHRPDPPGLTYKFTYDLSDLSREEVKAQL